MSRVREDGSPSIETASPRPAPSDGARSEPWLKAFFSASTAGMAVIGPDLRFVRVNETLAGFNGATVEKHSGRHLREVIPKLAPAHEPILLRVIATREPVLGVEIAGETPAVPGQVRRWRVSYFPLSVAPGLPPGVGVVAVETTAAHDAEQKLRRQQHLLLEAQQLGRIGSWEWNLVTQTMTWSEEVYRKFGFSPAAAAPSLEEMIALIELADRPRVESIIQQSLADHRPFSFDFHFRRPDGSPGIAFMRGEIDLGADGAPSRLYGVSQDVTERELAKEALQRSELLWRSVFSAAHDAILVHDADFRLLACNRAAEDMYGYNRVEFARMNFRMLHAQPDHTDSLPPIEARRETTHRRKDGSIFEVETSSRSFVVSGQPRVVQMVQDITARKAAAREVAQSREQLRLLATRLDSVREEEARRIAREVHDTLGQQLTALKLDLQYLESHLGSPAEEVARQFARLQTLLDGTIESAQRISGELRLGHLDVVGLGEAMRWHLRDFERRTGVVCHTENVREVSGVAHSCATTAFRIFQEAVTNVARHAHATELVVGLRLDGQELVLSVRDNGNGIAADRLNHPEAIGLLGMRERAQAIGGWLQIETGPEQGTAIVAHLPREPATD